MAKVYSPEATLVACGVVQQTKGDIAAARRAVGEAHEWLCTIDPSYRAPVVAAPVDDGKLRETQSKLAAALDAHQAALRDVRALEAKVRDLEAKAAKAAAPAPLRIGGAATYAEQTAKPAPDHARANATIAAAVDKPQAGKTYLLSEISKGKTWAESETTPAPSIAPDPFAHLPPAMREYARRAAAGATLDID